MPVLNPAEIWQESGRWDAIGEELFRLKDRKGADMALAMTHEEVVTWLAAREIHSYKQLPQMWYHIQTKERDEARPKSGILRTREFIMKDSYSLDVSDEALQESYRKHIGAYDRIYAALRRRLHDGRGRLGHDGRRREPRVHGLRRRRRGRDRLLPRVRLRRQRRDRRGRRRPRAAGERAGPLGAAEAPFAKATGAPVDLLAEAELDTPDCKTIDQVATYLGLPARAFVKALVVVPVGGERPRRGRRSRRLRPGHGPPARRPRAQRAQAAQGARRRVPPGDGRRGARRPGRRARLRRPRAHAAAGLRRRGAAPWATTSPAPTRPTITAAASALEQVPQATFADLRDARAGDPCAQCSGDLEGARVIEVGNIFQLGTKYSEPMGATFLDEDGKERPIVMGSYGIGLARIAAAAVEQHHDDNGIFWPASIAPYHVHLVLVRASDDVQRSLADELYSELGTEGFEVVYDDRDLSPGIKFKDADLLGCPAQVVVGKRAGEGFVELKRRDGGERRDVPVADLAAAVCELLAEA